MREATDERTPEPRAEIAPDAPVPRPRKLDEDTVRIKLSDLPDSEREGL